MKTKNFFFIIILAFLSIHSAFGQTQMPTQHQQASKPVNDSELKQFVKVYKIIQVLDQESQQKMITAIDGTGLSVQKYNEIQQTSQTPQAEVKASPEEMESYKLATIQVKKIQQETQAAMQKEIENNGITLQRYQEISVAIQQDQNMMKKFQEMMN